MEQYSTFPSTGHMPEIAQAMAKHERLVHWVVRRQWLGELSYAEALHVGRIGLWRALQGYDPSRGTAFSTYAVPAIARATWAEPFAFPLPRASEPAPFPQTSLPLPVSLSGATGAGHPSCPAQLRPPSWPQSRVLSLSKGSGHRRLLGRPAHPGTVSGASHHPGPQGYPRPDNALPALSAAEGSRPRGPDLHPYLSPDTPVEYASRRG